jgi:hypothetical protein
MRPVVTAAAVYLKEPCARTFREDLEAHLLHGHVISTPDFFCMGRKVYRRAQAKDIINPWFNLWESPPDCWHLYLFTGDIRRAFLCADVQLPHVSFERRNRLRFYTWDRIFSRTERIFTS